VPAKEDAAEMRASAEVIRRTALAVGEFSALVAHETNQPIAATLINCAAAMNHLREPNADLPRARDCIARIERDVARAGAIVQRIRSRMTNVQSEYEALDLNQLIEAALSFMSHEIGQADVAITKALHPDLPLVFGDRVQLEQVLINLFSNAIEAMRSNAAGTRALTVSTEHDGGQPLVTVRDTGPGVAPEALERAFEPLFTTKAEGLGLGLSISRSIVEAHGGRLWTAADAVPGACFRFTLRTTVEQVHVEACPSNVTRLPTRLATAGALRGRRVLGARSA
jgi:C4-dicarboxylate-specific signal transduction histidine kinase